MITFCKRHDISKCHVYYITRPSKSKSNQWVSPSVAISIFRQECSHSALEEAPTTALTIRPCQVGVGHANGSEVNHKYEGISLGEVCIEKFPVSELAARSGQHVDDCCRGQPHEWAALRLR